MNSVLCVTWVSKGKAISQPHKLQLPPEELKRLVDESKELLNRKKSAVEESSNETDEDVNTCEKSDNKSTNDDDDFSTRYNLDSYDNDDEENPLFTINDIAVHVDNHDDDYITDQESEGDLEEKENFTIKDSDNLLIVGHVEDESAVLEIYVYNQDEDAFYVHHDIVLPSYPLSLEWLDFHPADEKPGNYVAVGDMTSVIKIYDLDVVDILEPDYTLGKILKKKKNKEKMTKYHSDAVLSLSWNKNVRNLLASGSADSSVIIWDLTGGTVLNKLSFHSNKVQALEWHPTESQFLLSGCIDGFLRLYNCQSDNECKSWRVNGEIEKIVWNISDSFKFFCSTDQGYIYAFDIRNDEVEKFFQAHEEAVTGLDISPLRPDILISASMDKTLKVWDLCNNKIIKSLDMKVGSIYAAKVAPDLDLTVAVGGNYSSNNLKVIDIFKDKEVDNDEFEDDKTEKKIKKKKAFKVQNYGFENAGKNRQTKIKKKNYNTQGYDKSRESKSQNANKRKIFDSEENESNFQASTSVIVASKHKQKHFT